MYLLDQSRSRLQSRFLSFALPADSGSDGLGRRSSARDAGAHIGGSLPICARHVQRSAVRRVQEHRTPWVPARSTCAAVPTPRATRGRARAVLRSSGLARAPPQPTTGEVEAGSDGGAMSCCFAEQNGPRVSRVEILPHAELSMSDSPDNMR